MNSLEVKDLSVSYDGILALRNISLGFKDKEIASIIGANGAGKSTLLKAISGLIKPKNGNISFKGQDITNLKTYERLELGIVLCPEGRRLFPDMTVYENLKMGAYQVTNSIEFRRRMDFLHDIFPLIATRRDQIASSMSGGEQQMVAIARSLMSQPKLLLLDEPTLGLAPKLILEVIRLVQSINREGISVVLVEQNAKLALKVSDNAFLLESGNLSMQGSSEELLNSNTVLSAYLGN